MAEDLHPIIAEKKLTPGTPEAVLSVAGVFVQMKYEDNKANKDNIFGKWYGANHTSWCAEFVSYCFNKGGAGHVVNGLQGPKGFLSCTAGIKAMKKRGYKEVAAKDAQMGDIIFFDWDHNHDPDHVGIVLKNNPKKQIVTCREGNTSRGDGSRSNGGQCAQRDRNYSNVFTVFRPEWKAVSKPAAPAVAAPVTPAAPAKPAVPVNPQITDAVTVPAVPATPAAPAKIPNPGYTTPLKKGLRGTRVAYLQQQLGLPVTRTFDDATEQAVKKLQQKKKLTADGIVGPLTWKAIG